MRPSRPWRRPGLADFIRTLLRPAEDPRRTFGGPAEPAPLDVSAALAGLRGALADAETAVQGLASQREALLAEAERLDREAAEAVRSGRDDLARAALQQRWVAARQAEALGRQASDLTARRADLRFRLAELEGRAAREDLERRVETARAHADLLRAADPPEPTSDGDPLEERLLATERERDVAARLARLQQARAHPESCQ